MRFTKTIATASVAAVLCLAGAASTTPTTKPGTSATAPAAKPDVNKPGKVAAALRRRIRREAGVLAAKTIGINPADLRKELVSGKTIATIATDHDVSPQTVINTLVTAANKKIDAAVSAHKITAARGAKLEARVDKAIPKIVNDWHPKVKAPAAA